MTGLKSVLYIEDNYHNRRIVRKVLQIQGYVVYEAEDGLAGLRMVEELKPPLILLDIDLPLMDGLTVLARVRANPELRDTPVIAVTAAAMRGDRERLLEAGCTDYLAKPVQIMDLLEKVRKHYPVRQETKTYETISKPVR